MLFIVGMAVDPDKDRRSKQIYWVIAPLIASMLIAASFLDAHDPPRLGDVAGGFLVGEFFSYLMVGAIYLRNMRP